ncbi:MAG: hypothetical protein EP330_23685 [Deltaproteobacteria bacterium]|nr:MAG: hypothetical protein EP330_23685 [Deltaproteobacteria bacterium]
MDLQKRLQIFVDAGLVTRVPTRFQLLQGEFEMTPYVLSTDATMEDAYNDTLAAHPVLRQPALLREIGLDNLKTGSGLGMRLTSICKHLHFTWHQGFPVFDLQIIMTHPGGLDEFERRTHDLLADELPHAQRWNQLARRLFPDPAAYYGQFLGEDGWIARARRFENPSPADVGSDFPEEFFSLANFAQYCADTFPEHPSELGLRTPGRLLWLAGRRSREGRSQGWVDQLRARV